MNEQTKTHIHKLRVIIVRRCFVNDLHHNGLSIQHSFFDYINAYNNVVSCVYLKYLCY